jgi:hypothetical protein
LLVDSYKELNLFIYSCFYNSQDLELKTLFKKSQTPLNQHMLMYEPRLLQKATISTLNIMTINTILCQCTRQIDKAKTKKNSL